MNGLLIISGATGGIGAELVKQGVMQDYCVVALYRNEEKLQKILEGHSVENVKAIKSVLGTQMDTTPIENAIVESTERHVYFIHTAFVIRPIERIGKMQKEAIIESINSNVAGGVLLTEAIVRACRIAQKELTIVNITSGASDHPLKGWSLYGAGKAYMKHYFASLSFEDNRIITHQFDPGVVDTAMQESIRATSEAIFDRVDEFKEYKIAGELKQPSAIATEIMRIL